MKRLVILIVIVLLVAGGGGAAWWFLLREVPAEAVAEGADGEAIPEPEPKDSARKRFIEMEPMVLPIIREGQVTLHLTLVLAIELTSSLPKVEIAKLRRPLRDAILTELHSVYALRYVQEKGFDYPLVRERLLRISERVLGPGTVKAVLVRKIGTQVPLRS
jgi:flagellar protein FliL